MLLDGLQVDPDAPAVDDLTRTRTRHELDGRVRRLAGLLTEELALTPGDHAAMLMGNRVEFVELTLAALVTGVWITPVNWHLTAEEVTYILDDSGAATVFVDPDHAAVGRTAAGARRVIEVGPELDELLERHPPAVLDPQGPSGGSMFYTSGTTGRPKGVKRTTQATVAAQVKALRRSGHLLGLDGAGPHLVTGPLYHAAPVGFALMDLLNGAPMVVMPRWDEALALRLIEERGVVASHLVPTMFVRLLRLPEDERARADLATLRTVLHGAAPVTPAVKRRMIEWWGPVLVEYWGASEGGVVTLVSSEEWLAHPGTVGRAVATHEVFAGDDDGTPRPGGTVGTLWCRNKLTDNVFAYHNAPAKTAAAYAGPGTYSIGDLGWVDDDGYVFLSDRAANTIISGGVNIYPAEIEAVLAEHPAVGDVAVFGVPDDEWGESVKAAVEPAAGVGWSEEIEADVLDHARRHLAGYKVPRSIDVEAELPRTPAGKLLTRTLRDRYWQGRERSI